jgi:hypothetical protein
LADEDKYLVFYKTDDGTVRNIKDVKTRMDSVRDECSSGSEICGIYHGQSKTYSNKCQMSRSGAVFSHYNACYHNNRVKNNAPVKMRDGSVQLSAKLIQGKADKTFFNYSTVDPDVESFSKHTKRLGGYVRRGQYLYDTNVVSGETFSNYLYNTPHF